MHDSQSDALKVLSFNGKPKTPESWNFLFFKDSFIEIECGSVLDPERLLLSVEDIKQIFALWESINNGN